MSEYYFINERLVTDDNVVGLGEIDSDAALEPVNLLNGVKLSPEPTFINIYLTETSGDFYPDVFNSLITLFSNKIKSCLDDCGIQNIDYYPVKIINQKTNKVNADYWLANICDRIECVDVANSDTSSSRRGRLKFKSFCIDESRTMGAEIFRLHEKGGLIIMDERLHSVLAEAGLQGVVLANTRDYDGYGY